MAIMDFYIDDRGRKFEPQDVGETMVFLRSDHHGHIKNMVVPIVNGELDFRNGKTFPEKTQALSYIYHEEQRFPAKFVPSYVKEILKNYGK